jgi:uncharacterized protein (TIGR02246 family)
MSKLDLATDETAVKDLLAQMVAAWDANDADAFAELYTDDTVVVTTGKYTQGKEGVRAFMAGGFAGPLKGTTSVEEPDQIRFVTDDVAIVNTISGFVLPGEKTVQPSLERRATWVLRRGDDGWRVASYHNCPSN